MYNYNNYSVSISDNDSNEKKEFARNKSHVQFFKKSYSVEDYMTTRTKDTSIDMKRIESIIERQIKKEEQAEEQEQKKKRPPLSSKSILWLQDVYNKQHIGPFGKAADGEEHFGLFTYIFIVLIIIMFSGEILQSRLSTGEFFEMDPLNFMVGPSVEIMIQTGARFVPCMRDTDTMPPGENFVCLKTLLVEKNLDLLDVISEPGLDNASCTLQTLCGMTDFHQLEKPDQTFRFITPLVVHAGILHLTVNCWFLYVLGARLERAIGSLSYSILFMGTGIFGHAFGSLFAHITTPFLGCSSSVFGMIGYLFIDLVYHWTTLEHASLYLVKLLVLTAFSFILGILPWVDHFSHLGGLISGLLLGLLLIPISKREREIEEEEQEEAGQNRTKIKTISKKLVMTIVKVMSFIAYSVILSFLIYHFQTWQS